MDPSIDNLRASDGSGNASVATIQNVRAPLATTIDVDTVEGIPDSFYGTMGTPHTFVDPVTGETITVISEESAVDFRGHVDGTDLEIDEVAPGYTDNGSAVEDIVIIKPTSQWADALATVLDVSHEDDGSLKDDAVTTDVIADGAVTTDKIDAEAVTPDKLATGAQTSTNDTSGTTTSASFTPTLTGGGSTPAVTVTIGANGLALVSITSYMANSGSNTNRVSYAVSGANTIASSTETAITAQGTGNSQQGRTTLLTGLTPGSTTFTMQYNASGGTGTFANRNISVVPL